MKALLSMCLFILPRFYVNSWKNNYKTNACAIAQALTITQGYLNPHKTPDN